MDLYLKENEHIRRLVQVNLCFKKRPLVFTKNHVQLWTICLTFQLRSAGWWADQYSCWHQGKFDVTTPQLQTHSDPNAWSFITIPSSQFPSSANQSTEETGFSYHWRYCRVMYIPYIIVRISLMIYVPVIFQNHGCCHQQTNVKYELKFITIHQRSHFFCIHEGLFQ